MSDESSLPSVVRGADGTAVKADSDGLTVQSRTIEDMLGEMLLLQRRTVAALLILCNLADTSFSYEIEDLDEMGAD